ncbi:diacylglycerol/polyprenol kinase family protein [Labilibaculum sp.]|uniref:diacylglycerol/polyprenol kinase family protein n=1 Tax=Labilibaculum sp. TaxID=2060723 RepID=UPI003565EF77
MNNIVVLSFVYLVGIALLLAFNELNYRRLNIKGEITRKFAHFAACLATVPFPYIFTSHWYILVLALLFGVVLFITQYSNKLKSIHDIKRKSVGSYLLPLSIYLTFYLSCRLGMKIIYVLPMVILGVCDPMAAILGMNIKKMNGRIKLLGHKFNKTWLGSGAFLATSFVISIIALYFNRELFDLKTFWLAFAIALVSTLAEFISWRGSDNLTIPLSVVLMLVLFL